MTGGQTEQGATRDKQPGSSRDGEGPDCVWPLCCASGCKREGWLGHRTRGGLVRSKTKTPQGGQGQKGADSGWGVIISLS